MIEHAALRAEYVELSERLEGEAEWSHLRQVYLDLAPLIGRLQAAVSAAARVHGAGPAEESLEAMKRSARQVGHDMRLSSPGALRAGLEATVQAALATLDALDTMR